MSESPTTKKRRSTRQPENQKSPPLTPERKFKHTSAGFLLRSEGLFLLGHSTVEKTDTPDKTDKNWTIPKGLSEPGESLLSAALRELQEETSIDLLNDEKIKAIFPNEIQQTLQPLAEYVSGGGNKLVKVFFVDDPSGLIRKHCVPKCTSLITNKRFPNRLGLPELDFFVWATVNEARDMAFPRQKFLFEDQIQAKLPKAPKSTSTNTPTTTTTTTTTQTNPTPTKSQHANNSNNNNNFSTSNTSTPKTSKQQTQFNPSLPLVVLIDKQFVDTPGDCSIEQEALEGVANVKVLGALSAEEVPNEIEKAVGVLAWHHITNINEPLLKRMKNTKILVRIGMGYDNVDIKAAGRLGIPVSNVPDYGVEEVADSTLCLLLNLMRKIHFLATKTKQGGWPTRDLAGATRLHGRTFGIIGIGRIGTATALRVKAFGMNVIFFDPFVEHGKAKALGLGQVESLEQLLEQSDVVSVHCPLSFRNQSNKYLLNQSNLKLMKKGSYLINTARGPIVEEKAVVDLLEKNHFSGVALDVFEKEPYQPNGELLKHENVIMTPHSAFYSDQGNIEMRSKAALEVRRLLTEKPLWYCVNSEFLVKQ